MCLDTVDEKLTVPEEGQGWKWFKFKNGQPFTWFMGKQTIYPKNQWINERDYRHGFWARFWGNIIKLRSVSGKAYPYGFHIWTQNEPYGLPGNTWGRVQYRRAVATGTFASGKVVIAKEMKFL